MNAAKRREIFERLRAGNPNPETELNYTTPFELLIAVVAFPPRPRIRASTRQPPHFFRLRIRRVQFSIW